MKRIIFRLKNEHSYVYATVDGGNSKNFIVPKGELGKFRFSTRYALWENRGFDNSQHNGEGA